MSFHHLNRAISIAAEAHAGQRDRAGKPYILHPLRVMLAVPAYEDAQIAAVLHDVLEDCPEWTRDRLAAEGLSTAALDAIDAVTRRSGEEYTDFIARAGRNAIGREVKLADLRDNLDMSRIQEPTEADWDRHNRYIRAVASLVA